jgi:hypothetical protein
MIAAQLQERNLAQQPFSHITETSADRKDGWLAHTKASVRHISKFRLVCGKLRDSSLRSFGDILGDRVFRFTEVGLHDSALIAWDCTKNHSTLCHANRIYAHYHDDVTAFIPVLEAINCTGTTIRDLRLGPGHVSKALACIEAPRRVGKQSALSHINLDLGPADLCLPGRYGNGCTFNKIVVFPQCDASHAFHVSGSQFYKVSNRHISPNRHSQIQCSSRPPHYSKTVELL